MKRPAYGSISTKIEVNKDRIYRISDPIQLAEIFFPAKNAHQKRAAFLAIFFELKNAPGQRLTTTDHVAAKYGLSPSAITKSRAKMARIGLVRRRDGNWVFSSVFAKSLKNLTRKLRSFQTPADNQDQMEKEEFFIEIAKGGHR